MSGASRRSSGKVKGQEGGGDVSHGIGGQQEMYHERSGRHLGCRKE